MVVITTVGYILRQIVKWSIVIFISMLITYFMIKPVCWAYRSITGLGKKIISKVNKTVNGKKKEEA